jgi:hypothetical protein
MKYGSERVYVLVAHGVQPWKRTYRSFEFVGLGLHFSPAPRYYLDLDASWGSWSPQIFGDGPSNSLGRLRLMGGWELKRRLALFAGVSLNYYYHVPKDDEDRHVSWMPQWTVGGGSNPDRLWPGLLFGVRI